MRHLVLTLPLPPSANRLWRVNKRTGATYLSPDYRAWKKRALASLWPQKPPGGFPLFERDFQVQISVPLKMRGDIDNRLKAALDFLQSPAGIVANDQHAQRATIARSEDVKPHTCRVVIWAGAPVEPALPLEAA